MTYIHLILGSEPERSHTFNSLQELYDKIDAILEPNDTTKEASYHRKELLSTFDKNVAWMQAREIIVTAHDNKSAALGIRIDKEKLVKYIIDPEMPLMESKEDNNRKDIV